METRRARIYRLSLRAEKQLDRACARHATTKDELLALRWGMVPQPASIKACADRVRNLTRAWCDAHYQVKG